MPVPHACGGADRVAGRQKTEGPVARGRWLLAFGQLSFLRKKWRATGDRQPKERPLKACNCSESRLPWGLDAKNKVQACRVVRSPPLDLHAGVKTVEQSSESAGVPDVGQGLAREGAMARGLALAHRHLPGQGPPHFTSCLA